MSLIESGRRVLREEAKALSALSESLDERFDQAVNILAACTGKVVLAGMGKSGIVCRKISSTLSSTGTPAFFLHPAEGAHGDLGVLSQNDVVVAVSNSGETSELLGLLPLIRRMGLRLICITSNPASTLGRKADVTLQILVETEACPLNLAPMVSTTSTLALGDALAAALMEKRGVSEEDFALVHPAGALGRRLTLQVADLMLEGESVPRVTADDTMASVIPEISSKGLGSAGVFDEGGSLVGVITDGDLRRGIQSGDGFLQTHASDVMSSDPKTVASDMLAVEALRLMEDHAITVLFVTGDAGNVDGVIHIHHLVKAGL